MKYFEVDGMVGDTRKMQMFPARLYVGVSNDKIGRSLSINEPVSGIMLQIPVTDEIMQALRGRGDDGSN